MKRQIIKINEELCNGCGACANACHEAAIGMVDGKAKLLRDDFCDGLGNCLPVCPTVAIMFEEREAAAFDEKAVMENKMRNKHTGCPGQQMKQFDRAAEEVSEQVKMQSELAQWPCQIRLVPVNAPYFEDARLLIAADCTAYAYADIHREFMKGRVTIIGCPKLDDVDYTQKLAEIIENNNIKSITVIRMEVPCCGGIENAAKTALKNSGKFIPWNVVTISTDGKILDF